MKCKCGYDFAKAELDGLESGHREFEGYAAIRNEDYHEFILRETVVLGATNDGEFLTAIGHSSELVGTMHICPDCARMIFLKPKSDEPVYYRLDDSN